MNNGLDDHVVLNVTLLLFRIDYWLARCKIKATLIISRHVCQSVCLCVCLSATLTLKISETKRFRGSCPVGTL